MIHLGIDIGGSGIKGALVDTATGTLVTERTRLKTPRGGEPEAVLARVAELAATVGGTGAVGVGLPAVIRAGVVRMAANLGEGWIGVRAVEALEGAIGRRCLVLNDADAAGIAEMRVGAGVGETGVVLLLTFGTGIGSALFVDGHLVPNTEFGHIEVRGKEGEHRAAASVRERRNLTWEEWIPRVNEYLDHIERLVWPDLIIVGGGIAKEAPMWVPHLATRARVTVAALRNNAGIVGAALRAAELTGTR